MPRFTVPTLENEIAQRLVTAAAAAATTYIRPARFPKWVRRGITASNTLTSVGLAMAGERRPAPSELVAAAQNDSKNTVDLVNGQPKPRTAFNWASATSAGMALVTSGIAMRLDKGVEKALFKRGVRHPRLWMAVGAATISLIGPWVVERAQERLAALEKPMPKETLAGRLADPLGKDVSQPALPAGSQVRGDDEEERTEGDEQPNS